MKRIHGVFISIITLTLCLSTGCPKKAEEQRVEKCTATDTIRTGEYIMVNDDYEHPGYAQCIFEDPKGQTMGWMWEAKSHHPESNESTTLAYVFSGDATMGPPWTIESTTQNLPIEVENIRSMTIEYNTTIETTSYYRLGVRTLDSYVCTVGSCLSASLTIDLYSKFPGSYQNIPYYVPPFQKRVTVAGEEYDFYKFTSSTRVSSYLFVKVRPSLSGRLHLHRFLDFLQDEVYDGYSLQLFEIEHLKFFQEIWGGGNGRSTIYQYSINVESHFQ